MGFLGFILIAILVICVVVMVRKFKRENEPGPYTGAPAVPYAPTYGTTPAVPYANPAPAAPVVKPAVSPTPAKTAPATASQHTIYVYRPKQATRLCPHCDGENNASAAFCVICGQHLY